MSDYGIKADDKRRWLRKAAQEELAELESRIQRIRNWLARTATPGASVSKNVKKKFVHWTQLPKNKKRLVAIRKKAAAKRLAKESTTKEA